MPPSNSSRRSADPLGLTRAVENCFAAAALVVDSHLKIVAYSSSAATLLRLKPGQTALPVAWRGPVEQCFATGQPQSVAFASTKGSNSTLAASATMLRRGAHREVVLLLHDLAPLRPLEQNLLRLDRLASIGALSASMAHEIKNALVAIKTFTDLLLEKGDDAELAQTVSRELHRINSLVGQMLKFVGPARTTFGPVRIHEVLEHSLRMIQRQLDEKLISLNRCFEAPNVAIRGDDYQLEQAFLNLFLNALEAMGPNGALRVSTDLVPAEHGPGVPAEFRGALHLRVRVQDTGIGIAAQNMTRLFEPFFTTKQNGTGLGLPICQRIVLEHHGAVSVQSEPNKGTTICVLLPAPDRER